LDFLCWVAMVTSRNICNYGNQGMYFTVGTKLHKDSNVTIDIRGSSLLGDWLGECRVDPVGSGQGLVGSFCEYGDEP
jgi:hypothetical protein